MADVHPELQTLLSSFPPGLLPKYCEMDATLLRTLFDHPLDSEAVEVASVTDIAIATAHGNLPARLYQPEASNDKFMLYFHGGGFVMGTLDTHDTLCRLLSQALGCVLVSVVYRLAPEQPFPCATDDCMEALRWACAHKSQWVSDAAPVLLAGDSAGATLCVSTALQARSEPALNIAAQILLYPTLEPPQDNDSYRLWGGGEYFLGRDMMRYFWDSYLGEADKNHDYAVPAFAQNLEGLPKTLVVTAQYDPLADEAVVFSERLKQAGVAQASMQAPAMIHGFMTMPGLLKEKHSILRFIKENL